MLGQLDEAIGIGDDVLKELIAETRGHTQRIVSEPNAADQVTSGQSEICRVVAAQPDESVFSVVLIFGFRYAENKFA